MTETPSTPPALQPGDEFWIEYGGRVLQVKALHLNGQRKLAAIVKKLMQDKAKLDTNDPDGMDLFDHAAEAVEFVAPDVDEDFMNTIDVEMAIEIATKTLGKQSLSEEERKKFDSPR